MVTAGEAPLSTDNPKLKAFEGAITEKLAGAVIGMREGQIASMPVTAERVSGLPEKEQINFSSAACKQVWQGPEYLHLADTHYFWNLTEMKAELSGKLGVITAMCVLL